MDTARLLRPALLAAVLCAGLATPARADTAIVISQGVDPDTLDPIRVSVTPSSNVHAQIYEPLVRRDGAKYTPVLATSWKRVTPTVWEFKLRPNVKWQDGTPFTSADVKFTIEKILDPSYHSQQLPRVDTVTAVEAPDPLTVRMTTKRPTALPPAITRPVFIVSAAYWKAHGDAYMQDHAMGTGPYVLKSWRKDDELDLERNPSYWGPRPQVDRVAFRPIPEAASRVAAVKTGASDLITNVPYQYALQLTGGRSTQMASVRSVRVLYIAFNTMKPGPQQNKLVRQALNYAIDVPQIIKAVLGGRGYEAPEPIPSSFFGYDPSVPAYHHDAAKAKELLAKAGYPDGKGLELVLNTPNGRYNGDKDVATAIAGQLQAFGVKVDVRPQEWTTYIRQADNRALTPMYLLGWGNLTYDADNTLSSQLSSEGTTSTYGSPEVDKLIDAARYELDAKKRQALYSRALHIIHDDAPWLFLFQYEDLYATTKRIKWQPRSDESILVPEITVLQ